MEVFNKYGEYYDLIYGDKDYEGECAFLEEVFRTFSPKPVASILDAGCGTGRHAIPLVKRGYQVTGIDASETAIRKAQENARLNNTEWDSHVMDLRNIELNQKFDACVCMFAVINYLTTNEDIRSALAGIRRHLEKGSLFVFDCWNGLAVLRELPSPRIKTVDHGDLRIVRFAEPELDAFRHLCKVNYRMVVTRDRAVVDEIEETHTVRFLFPQEIVHYLEDADFEVLHIGAFGSLQEKVDEHTWNIGVVAEAR